MVHEPTDILSEIYGVGPHERYETIH